MRNAIYNSTHPLTFVAVTMAAMFAFVPVNQAKADCNYAGASFTCGSDAREEPTKEKEKTDTEVSVTAK